MASNEPISAVLNNPDLVCAILRRADLSPTEFVSAGLVCKSWRQVCQQDEAILVGAAKQPAFLTKGAFMGLFALSSAEADQSPRNIKRRRGGGVMFMYGDDAIDSALSSIGGLAGRGRRLADRARKQASVEQTFGPLWRETQWLGHVPKRVRQISHHQQFSWGVQSLPSDTWAASVRSGATRSVHVGG